MVNTYSRFIKGCCMIAALLMVIPLAGQNGKDSPIFKTRRQTNVTRSLTKAQITTSDTIPLQNLGAIYAFSIDATITQPREASFVRIVLEDAEGHDYLVAESDRFRNDTTFVQLTEYCEETARLDGIIPIRLKCYLAGDATLLLTSYHVSDQEPTRGQTANEETVAAIKEAQVQSIVDRINEYNVRHGKLWRAGLNSWSLVKYDSNIKGEGDAYTANFKYYTDGIYEMGERSAQRSTYNSPYVESFDWRNRHGKNWMTDSIGDQTDTIPCCQIFASVASTEALTNLYFNKQLQLNLSEQDIYDYSIFWAFQTPNSALLYIQEYGVIDETSLPFIGDHEQNYPRPEGNELISIAGSDNIWNRIDAPNTLSMDTYTDSIKKLLISNGPGVWGFSHEKMSHKDSTKFNVHWMSLCGYGVVTSNDYYTYVENNPWGYHTHISGNDAGMIGKTYWIFKDSFGHRKDNIFGHNGYRYVIVNDYELMNNRYYYITSPITRRGHSDNEIVVEDLDGDGYFNWGIGPRPNNRLPSWAEQEEDGNDNNRFKGAMNQYGYIADVNYSSPTIVIDHNMTDTELIDSIGCSRFLRRHIRINPGVTFTIHGSLAFYSGKRIYMNNFSTLVIDGGSLVDPTLYKSNAGGKVVIKNGGKIICHKKSNFVLPDEITMEMYEGSIFE